MIERRKSLPLLCVFGLGLCELLIAVRSPHAAGLHIIDILQLTLTGICFGFCLPVLAGKVQVGAMNNRARTMPLLLVGLLQLYLAARRPRVDALPGADTMMMIVSGCFIGAGLVGFAILLRKARRPAN